MRPDPALVRECYKSLPVDWHDRVRGFRGLAYRFGKYRKAVEMARQREQQIATGDDKESST